MDRIKLTPTLIKQLLNNNYQNKGICTKLADDIKIHAYGRVPERLINERRPSESEEIKDYRKQIYVPKTKNPISKVISSLGKIQRSQDWSIQYNQSAVSNKIAEGETLFDYCEKKYPVHTSITNWCFSELLRQYLLDANGIVAVIPFSIPESTSEYVKPIATFFGSEQIVNYVENEYVVLKSKDTSTYTTPEGQIVKTDGAIYYIITRYECLKYEQINVNGDLEQKQVYEHNIGILPAFKVGGLFKERINNDTIYESRIAAMIPSLDEAAREYSDLQAEIVQHIHSEKYGYTNSECSHCRGVGKVTENGKQVTCKHCNGTGSVLNVSPYGMYLIENARAGEAQLPAPPIGYVQKSSEIARLQDERVRQHLLDALSAVNMEFLAETPLSQSGVAKEVDRDELNNFVNAIAEDLVRCLDNVYFFINEYRYLIIVENEIERREMLPNINVPVKYDLLNTNILMQQLTSARNAQLNPVILRAMEIDFARKQFCTDEATAAMTEATFDLDPLFGISEENKMVMLSNGGITERDYVISCNITSFVRKAINDDEDFYKLTYEKKMEKMRLFADEIIKENAPQKQMVKDFGGL